MNAVPLLAGVVIASLLAVARPIESQEPPQAQLGGVTIRIGMPALDARKALEQRFDVRSFPDLDGLIVVKRRGSDETVGALNVRGGRIAMISEDWPIQAVTEEEFGEPVV